MDDVESSKPTLVQRLVNTVKDFEDEGKIYEVVTKLKAGDTPCCYKLCVEVPSWLFSLYRIVFRQTVEEVTLSGPGTSTRQEYLLGGYGVQKRPFMVHVYFVTMMSLVANWFCHVF